MKNRLFWVGCGMVGLIIMMAILAPLLSPFAPDHIALENSFLRPNATHLLGTDQNGGDILSQIIYGSRVSIEVGIFAVGLSLLIGIIIGALAGYYGGIIDTLAMRLVDIFLAFPSILLAIAIASLLGPGVINVIFAISFFGWVSYARLIRGKFLALRQADYVQAARCSGTKDIVIIFRHILPNSLAPIIVQASFGLAGAILAESSLSFLGLGVPANVASWGSMLSDGTRYLTIAPYMSTFPGFAIMISVLGFNLIGDGLRDKFDVKR